MSHMVHCTFIAGRAFMRIVPYNYVRLRRYIMGWHCHITPGSNHSGYSIWDPGGPYPPHAFFICPLRKYDPPPPKYDILILKVVSTFWTCKPMILVHFCHRPRLTHLYFGFPSAPLKISIGIAFGRNLSFDVSWDYFQKTSLTLTFESQGTVDQADVYQ